MNSDQFFLNCLSAVRDYAKNQVKTLLDRTITNDRRTLSESTHSSFSLVSSLESWIINFQNLLIWENPRNSVIALTGFTFVYWFFMFSGFHFLSTVATLGFCYHFYEMWVRYLWPEIRAPNVELKENWTEINPKVLTVSEIQSCFLKLKTLCFDLIAKIIQFRKNSHGIFCCLSVSLLLFFYYIGYYIPGAIIAYVIAIFLFLTPGFVLYVIPREVFDIIIKYISGNETSSLNNKQILIEKRNVSESSTNSAMEPKSFIENFNLDEPRLSDNSGSYVSDDSDDFELISEFELVSEKNDGA